MLNKEFKNSNELTFVNCRVLKVTPEPKDVIQNGCVTVDYAKLLAEYGGNRTSIQLRGDVAKRFLKQCDRRCRYDFTVHGVCKLKTRPNGRKESDNRFYVENFQKTNKKKDANESN